MRRRIGDGGVRRRRSDTISDRASLKTSPNFISLTICLRELFSYHRAAILRRRSLPPKFFLQGRFVFGPDVRLLDLTIFLVVAPVAVFCIFVARKLMDDFVDDWGVSIMVIAVVFTFYRGCWTHERRGLYQVAHERMELQDSTEERSERVRIMEQMQAEREERMQLEERMQRQVAEQAAESARMKEQLDMIMQQFMRSRHPPF